MLQRAAAMLAERPDSAAPLAAFLDILARRLAFPAKGAPPAAAEAQPAAAGSIPSESPAPPEDGHADGRDSWIPILGRSAAGVPQFWSSPGEDRGTATLRQLAARHARRRASRFEPAAASGLGTLRGLSVQIVTLEGPDDSDVAEYVVCGEIKARHPDAFAVRIDGESMSPEIRHGDLVVLSPSAPASEGRPAVVQLRRQIGVTCKLYRLQGQAVHLVPVNEQFAPQVFAAEQVEWALRVLATIRPGARAAVAT